MSASEHMQADVSANLRKSNMTDPRMTDPRNHYCICGAWGTFGKTDPITKITIWRCGMDANRDPVCREKGRGAA